MWKIFTAPKDFVYEVKNSVTLSVNPTAFPPKKVDGYEQCGPFGSVWRKIEKTI